jgi:nicotinamidase/pyrazinamidase
MARKALILVDIQNDFCPGGALAVKDGDVIIPLVNRLQPAYDVVAATQDWHPGNHKSFASNNPGKQPGEMAELGGSPQVMWPDHCVQNTKGAEFHPLLDMSLVKAIFRKGMDPEVDSYSGLFDNGRKHSTGLADWLRGQGVAEVHVVGLATDYCVKWTALDAQAEGFATTVIEDASRGVELQPGDVARALDELRAAGVRVATAPTLA